MHGGRNLFRCELQCRILGTSCQLSMLTNFKMQASHVRVKMVTCLVHPSCLQVLETLENFGGYFQGIVCNLLGISPASDY